MISDFQKKVIFDTDMSGDCDDAGALAILHKLADAGYVDILACVVNGLDEAGAAAGTVKAINQFYQRGEIPIGTLQESGYQPVSSLYTEAVCVRFDPTSLRDSDYPKALDIYRKILADAAPSSVTIIAVGFLSNLSHLLNSPPDELSALSGRELIKQKVAACFVMGGHFPESGEREGEYNFAWGGVADDTAEVLTGWPGEICILPFEAGAEMLTGQTLQQPMTNPVRYAYELFNQAHRSGRPSWDLLTVLSAVFPESRHWSFVAGSQCQLSSDGRNQWIETPENTHRRFHLYESSKQVELLLNKLLAMNPGEALQTRDVLNLSL